MGDDQPDRAGAGTERPVPGRNPADVQHISAEWAAEVVREVIGRVAPRELAVFDTVAPPPDEAATRTAVTAVTDALRQR
jgi:hypothetical protein